MKTIFKALFLFITLGISAQQSATESEVVTKALQEKEALTNTSIIKNISTAGNPINIKKNGFICLIQNYIINVYLSNYE